MEDLSAKLRAELNMFMNLKEFNLEEVSQINTIVDFKFIGIRILDKTDKK
ncbi:MAG: hypothetical protein IPO21_19260 [Bacteroidales bacterium]|nr:hypothetical protein [Bacteroidales bacterium]